MYCVRCGRAIPADSLFCVYCGAQSVVAKGFQPARPLPPTAVPYVVLAPPGPAPLFLRVMGLALGTLGLLASLAFAVWGSQWLESPAEPLVNGSWTAPVGEPLQLSLPPLATPGAFGTEVEAIATARKSVVRVETDTGSGSGIVLTADGYFLTNQHVIEDAKEISVILPDGRRLTARLARSSTTPDLAVLKATASDLVAATWGDSDGLQLGQTVVAIGHSLGFQGSPSVSRGIVSALRSQSGVKHVQTDAALNPGNSGGPLVDLRGTVVGISTLRIEREGLYAVQGVNFAIASGEVRKWLGQ